MEIKNISAALIKAKANFKAITKDKTNPHFKSKYASLDSVLEAVDSALGEAGLLLIQPTETRDGGTVLKTILIHAESGETLESIVSIPTSNDPQKFGSALTYYRRFCLCSFLGIAPDEDDDGNKAVPTKGSHPPPPKETPKTPIQLRKEAVKDLLDELGWSQQAQKDWAQTISKLPSNQWTEKIWNLALADLQEKYDEAGIAAYQSGEDHL